MGVLDEMHVRPRGTAKQEIRELSFCSFVGSVNQQLRAKACFLTVQMI